MFDLLKISGSDFILPFELVSWTKLSRKCDFFCCILLQFSLHNQLRLWIALKKWAKMKEFRLKGESEKSQWNNHEFLFQMLTKTIMFGIRNVAVESRRGFGIAVPAMQKASDPIQKLFLDKVREYGSKSKWVESKTHVCSTIITNTVLNLFFRRDGGLVDATPQIQAELKSELERIAKVSSTSATLTVNQLIWTFLSAIRW